MVQEIKAHIARHKVAYLVGSHVVIAGITYAITRGRHAILQSGMDGSSRITVRPYCITRGNVARGETSGAIARGEIANTASFIFRNKQTINVRTVVDRTGRGHPGWPVQNLETKRVFFSQKDAADAFNIPSTALGGHLNGKFPDVDGLHFQRVDLVPTS